MARADELAHLGLEGTGPKAQVGATGSGEVAKYICAGAALGLTAFGFDLQNRSTMR
jgi:hypothetical protein